MRNKKWMALFILVVFAVTSLGMVGCGQKTEAPKAPEAAKPAQPAAPAPAASTNPDPKAKPQNNLPNAKYVLTYGHVDSTDPYTSTGQAFGVMLKQYIEGKSGGQVRVDIYPGSQLGAQRELFEATMLGTVDMCSNGEGVMAGFYQPVLALSIPYLFRSEEIAWRVLAKDSEFGKQLWDGMLAKTGVRTLAVGDNGFRCFTSNKKQIKTPEDIKGMKIRTMENPAHMAMVTALGGQPTPIAWSEVYGSLQQGVIDGQENPPRVTRDAKLQEVQKYLTLDGHLWGINNILINEKKYQSLPDDIKAIVYEAAQVAAKTQKGVSTLANQMSVDALAKAGMTVYTPTAEDLKKFRDVSQKPVIDYVVKQIGQEWVDKMMAAVAKAEKEVESEAKVK